MSDTTTPVPRRLAEPFDPAFIKFKPQVISGNRAMATAYVDARAIQDRLDDVVGVEGWQDDYEALPDGSVICRLKLKLGESWVAKTDVGGPSEQPDGGDRMKAAFSDALKRAAVKFGVGRYLYRLGNQWADWDPQKKQFVQTPKLPPWALPGGRGSKPAAGTATQPAAGTPASPQTNGHGNPSPAQPPVRAPAPPRDPAELITQAERDHVVKALFTAGKTWKAAAGWLSNHERVQFPTGGQLTDLHYGGYCVLMEALKPKPKAVQ